MKKTPLLLIVVFLIGFVAGVLVWQRLVVKRLAGENAVLQNQLKETLAAAEADATSGKDQIAADELKRLRDGQAELLRLRGQVANLRRDAATARALATNALARLQTNEVVTLTTNASPIESFTAHVTETVGWKQTLVMGGWEMPGGKRGFVLVTPNQTGNGDQVQLTTQLFEVAEEKLLALGNNLDAVRAKDNDSTTKNVFPENVAKDMLELLKATEGVNLLATPQVITGNGRQAQVQVTEVHTAPNGEVYHTGPIIDIVPIIGADGKSVEMAVGVQLNVKRLATP